MMVVWPAVRKLVKMHAPSGIFKTQLKKTSASNKPSLKCADDTKRALGYEGLDGDQQIAENCSEYFSRQL